MAERLHFNTNMAYESMLAAEHLARYWLLREACKGKRVLDVACGEGYGSSLLRTWGATEVVGIDLSQDAIENANICFASPGISYRTGDACNLHTVLAETENFDLIACFETMEHVPDVPGLLRGIRKHLAPGGSIAISCPNDAEMTGGNPNEFHLKIYAFEEFRATTTEILGPAVQWQLGTPVLGFGVCNLTDRWTQGTGAQLASMLDGGDSAEARFLPAQAGHEVSAHTASFYLGIWGTPLPRTMVVAPIAYRAYVAPWNNWVAAREEINRLLDEKAMIALERATLLDQQLNVHDIERRQMLQEAQLRASELDACNQQSKALATERDRLQQEHTTLLDQQAKTYAIERDQIRQEAQEQKNELVAYKRHIADERSARLLVITKLYEKQLENQQIQNAYQTTKVELQTAHEQLAVLRNECQQIQNAYYSSEADLHRTHRQLTTSAAEHQRIMAEREELGTQLHVLRSSRMHRATLRYYRLYEHGATSWFIRPLRRSVARLRRLIKG